MPTDDTPKIVRVRVLGHFYVRGKLARPGDVVELDEYDARDLTRRGKAEPADKPD